MTSTTSAGNGRYLLVEPLDPIAEYQLSLRHMNGTNHEWWALSGGDQLLKKKYERLDETERVVYWRLIRYLRHHVRVHLGGPSNFGYLGVPLVWNWPTWHHIILKVAAHSATLGDANDCWLSTYALTKTSRGDERYVSIGVTLGRNQKVVDRQAINRAVTRYNFTNAPGFSQKNVRLARIAAVLLRGPPPSEEHQASHLCFNHPQRCFNPRHIVWELAKYNANRRCCVFGTSCLCPHRPRCIWTGPHGEFLPCRNRPLSTLDCECTRNCFGTPPTEDPLLHEEDSLGIRELFSESLSE